MLFTRRTLLGGSLCSLAGSARAASNVTLAAAVAQPSALPANVRYIMPVPAGSRNGDGWANAAPILQLSAMIAAAGPGGTVFVRADAGSYSVGAIRVGINSGGQPGLPVTIVGVDQALNPM